jgi:hypothetical protein
MKSAPPERDAWEEIGSKLREGIQKEKEYQEDRRIAYERERLKWRMMRRGEKAFVIVVAVYGYSLALLYKPISEWLKPLIEAAIVPFVFLLLISAIYMISLYLPRRAREIARRGREIGGAIVGLIFLIGLVLSLYQCAQFAVAR